MQKIGSPAKQKASETKIVDEEELIKAKEVMGEKKYQQEFECDWIANIEGAVYGDIIAKMEDDKQIARVPYDPHCLSLLHGI